MPSAHVHDMLTFIAFLRQQLFRERTSVFLLTYTLPPFAFASEAADVFEIMEFWTKYTEDKVN